jgi:chromosome partitioning protein
VKRIIAVANQKGGVGKTTTVINVAAYLAKSGKRVLIVDLDPQGNSSSGLAIGKNELKSTLYDVLVGDVTATEVICQTAFERIDVLPSNSVLAAAEVELTRVRSGRENRLRRALKDLDYDVILVDCPPSLGLLTVNGLTAADFVMIPVQSEYYALEGLGQLLATIKRVRQVLNPKLGLLGIVITMHNNRTSLATQVEKELQKHFGHNLFDSIIPRNVRLAEAPSHGKPILYYDRFCRGASAYKKLSREIAVRAKL